MRPSSRRPLRPRSSLVGGSLPSVTGDHSASSTPVYERQRTTTESTPRARGARLLRDRVCDVLLDGRYHSAHELNNLSGVKSGDWVVVVRELIEFGYAFTRRSNSLLMRRRDISEKPQDLADLLALVDARVAEDVNGSAAEVTVVERPVVERRVRFLVGAKSEAAVGVDGALGFGGDAESLDVEEGDRVVVSVDPKGFVLSGKQLLTSTQAILAKKRSGKTYTAMVMAEQLLQLGLPFVAVDPTGVWCGLRTLADGTPSPYNILTLGGARGHLPISASLGEAVADMLVEMWPMSAILDLSAMVPDEQHEFVFRLCARTFVVNKKPRHFFFDEADEFGPQVCDSNCRFQRRCLSAIDRMVRRGGVKGLGSTLITQRPAVINKNLLSQVVRIIVLNMVAPHDIEAVEEWLRTVVPRAEDRMACLASLPLLGSGEAFAVTNGAGVAPLVRFRTRPKETFDSSKTPTMDEVDLPAVQASDPSSDVVERVSALLGLAQGGVVEVRPEIEEPAVDSASVED